MSVRTTTAAAATVVTAALLVPPPAPAAAVAPEQRGRLLLTLSGTEHTWIRGVRLVCPASGGRQHPHAAEACAGLAAAGGRPDALPRTERLCPAEEEPVEASAEGDWGGAPVRWKRTFRGACALDAATGAVFRF
ncbi:SSI family serine proteinase inhibitor [Streptomyces luteireticuli]|uniref:SSI family serine proteinase inhibitor n=1 Tax=Streptomyces luteireticuli TaxID=173858 RepID=UPI003558677D